MEEDRLDDLHDDDVTLTAGAAVAAAAVVVAAAAVAVAALGMKMTAEAVTERDLVRIAVDVKMKKTLKALDDRMMVDDQCSSWMQRLAQLSHD